MHRYKDTPYFVSRDGKVFREGSSKALIPDVSTKGYMRVTFCIEGVTARYLIHRLVAEVYIPNIDNKEYINHIDNNPSNNRVENLEWCTHSENMKHSHVQGRCSNILASNAATQLVEEQAQHKFKTLLGPQFVSMEVKNRRRYIVYTCYACKKQLRSRVDSPVFLDTPVTCRYCV